ncbi:cytochrome p450 [Colletotrichum truncatum]|uniref:Cytochrome p450 n=1 Tax=Colletotrichum truncatum TaxID=5467 RepID=A0ACC3ZH05_COLTU|nr:cytochrome p450 [Colletotrichum truncatum]KAF6790542.1 cytochrome p450 [Colletotrichum truncatum]
MELSVLAGTILAVVIGLYAVESAIILSKGTKEPKYVRPRVPLIGHLIGISKHTTGPYFTQIASTQKSGIFVLPVFTLKLYVIVERRLVGAIQRHAKTLSFTPFAAKVASKLSGVGEIALKMHNHLEGPPEAKEYDRVQRAALSAGTDLDAMTLVATKVQMKHVDNLFANASKTSGARIELYEWVRHLISVSASEGMFGPMNPFNDPVHEADFWYVESGNRTFADASHLMMIGGLTPKLFARSAVRARERNGKRYEEYVRRGGVDDSSGLVKARYRVLKANGATDDEIARIHIGFDIAMLANYAPTAFWALYEVLSRPSLVAEIREEVRNAVVTDGEDADFTLDLSIIKRACPLLLSSVQETQRLNSVQMAIREILRDTNVTIDDKEVLLKKGNFLQVNGITMLQSEETWGPNAAEYDPYRFIKMKRTPGTPGVAAANELPPNAFSVWGLAPHVCPARWYATGGILAMIAMMVLRFDFDVEEDWKVDESSGRAWKKPQAAKGFSALPSPAEPVPLFLKARKEFEGKWGVRIGAPSTRLQLSVA